MVYLIDNGKSGVDNILYFVESDQTFEDWFLKIFRPWVIESLGLSLSIVGTTESIRWNQGGSLTPLEFLSDFQGCPIFVSDSTDSVPDPYYLSHEVDSTPNFAPLLVAWATQKKNP
jgi:hypothetical protein